MATRLDETEAVKVNPRNPSFHAWSPRIDFVTLEDRPTVCARCGVTLTGQGIATPTGHCPGLNPLTGLEARTG